MIRVGNLLNISSKQVTQKLLGLILVGFFLINVAWVALPIRPVSAAPLLIPKSWADPYLQLGSNAKATIGPLAADLVGDDA